MSTANDSQDSAPVFKAVSSSARQLFQLLNCIRFASKAQVKITADGVKVTVEDSRVMQGEFFCDIPEHWTDVNSMGLS